MKKLWIPLTFALMSCSSVTKREPAQITIAPPPPPPSACEKKFQSILGHLDPAKGARDSTIYPQAKFLAEQIVPELQRRYEKTSNLPNGCGRARAMKQLASEVAPRLYAAGLVKKVIRQESEKRELIETHAMFNDPNFAARVACHTQRLVTPDNSLDKCGFDENSDQAALRRFGLSIFDCVSEVEGQRRFDAAEYQSVLLKYTQKIRPFVNASIKTLLDGAPAIENAFEGLNHIAQKIRAAPSSAEGCPAPPPDALAQRYSAAILRTADGSGFFTKSKGETILITAEHVASRDVRSADLRSGRVAEVKPEAKSILFADFTAAPGLFSFGSDVMMAKHSWDGPVLEVAPANTTPSLGQKLWAIGYPGSAAGQIRAYACTFEGISIGGRRESKEPAYLLLCSGIENSAGGASGGAVVDEVGRVWAVLSAENSITGHLLASPIGRDGNEIKIGFSKPMLTELCMNPMDWTKTRKCTVMPQQFETGVP